MASTAEDASRDAPNKACALWDLTALHSATWVSQSHRQPYLPQRSTASLVPTDATIPALKSWYVVLSAGRLPKIVPGLMPAALGLLATPTARSRSSARRANLSAMLPTTSPRPATTRVSGRLTGSAPSPAAVRSNTARLSARLSAALVNSRLSSGTRDVSKFGDDSTCVNDRHCYEGECILKCGANKKSFLEGCCTSASATSTKPRLSRNVAEQLAFKKLQTR